MFLYVLSIVDVYASIHLREISSRLRNHNRIDLLEAGGSNSYHTFSWVN